MSLRLRRVGIVIVIALFLVTATAYTGCIEDDEEEENGEDLTGTAEYEGTWDGTIEGDPMDGDWEFQVDFDEETVTGSFSGDASGDIDGSVSDGELEADGDAAFGTVEWSGEFSSDGDEVSGTWSYVDGEGDGDWEGSIVDDPEDDEDIVVNEFTVNGEDDEVTIGLDDDLDIYAEVENEGDADGEIALEVNGQTHKGYVYDVEAGEEKVIEETHEHATWEAGEFTASMGDKEVTVIVEDDDPEDENYWNAFDFESEVVAESGANTNSLLQENGEEAGYLTGFTYEHTYIEEGSEKSFEIETTYEGITETEITVEKYDLSGGIPDQDEIPFDLEVYELQHTVTVLQDDEDLDHPEWIELTVYLPIEDYTTEEVEGPMGEIDFSSPWIYAKAEYSDSEDNQAMLSYYLTEDMAEEMEDDDDIYYVPYQEGEFGDYDFWVLNGLYGLGWTWFQPFTNEYSLREGSWDIPTPEGTFSFELEETTTDLSGYTFISYDITCSAVTFEEERELQGTFVPSLPVPVYLQVGDETTLYEMELTDIQIGEEDDDDEDDEADMFELMIDIDGEGTVEVNDNQIEDEWSETYDEGTELNLEAVAAENWYFDEWTGDYSGEDDEINIIMNEDKSITANFETDEVTTYELDIDIEGEGSVEIDPEQEEYEGGTEVVLTAEPDENWIFVGWMGDYIGDEEEITLTMDEDKQITAIFEGYEY